MNGAHALIASLESAGVVDIFGIEAEALEEVDLEEMGPDLMTESLWAPVLQKYEKKEALVPTGSESHGGDDVGIWARGPGSAAVRGSVEQNTIFPFLLQSTPHLREAVCEAGACNADGVPVELPAAAALNPR